jgi:GH25 family lysozyme M1 (1,4-beta-N-acetylmuramidase)
VLQLAECLPLSAISLAAHFPHRLLAVFIYLIIAKGGIPMTLNGIDVSHWQTADASRTVAYDFLICKATEGAGYVDAMCNTHYANAKAKGKLVGVYHYARADMHPGTAGAIKEADYFLTQIANYVGEAALVLDWEAESVLQGPAWAKAWLDRVYAKTGIRPWFYTYQAALKPSYSILTDYPLWVAKYGANTASGYRPNAPKPNIAPWTVLTAYQYSSNGNLQGYSGRLDLDAFYGDADTWRKLCTGSDVGAVKPPSGPTRVTISASLPIIDLSGSLPVSGKDVTALQGLLLGQWQGKDAVLGANGYPDGIADTGTRNALLDFQKENGLKPDAICSTQTWAALLNQPSKG